MDFLSGEGVTEQQVCGGNHVYFARILKKEWVAGMSGTEVLSLFFI